MKIIIIFIIITIYNDRTEGRVKSQSSYFQFKGFKNGVII